MLLKSQFRIWYISFFSSLSGLLINIHPLCFMHHVKCPEIQKEVPLGCLIVGMARYKMKIALWGIRYKKDHPPRQI